MASISVNFGANDAYTVKLSWSETSRNVASNQTTLKFTCTLHSNRSSVSFSSTDSLTDTLTIGGTAYSVTHGAYTLYGSSSVTLWTKTVTVTHDADGTCEADISAAVKINHTFSSSGYIGTVTASGTLTCTRIPRASTLTCGTVTIGDAVSLNISRASSSFTHTITYAVGEKSGTIAAKTTKTTLSWTPSPALADQITTAKSGTCTLTLTTYAGTTAIGSKTYTVKIHVPKRFAPTVAAGWAAASYYNTGTAAAPIAAFVKGYSRAQITFYASKITVHQGATIQSYKITCGGVTVSASPYRTPVLNSTAATVVCTVTDSRGYTASEKLSITLYPYSRPKLSAISLYRADASGNADDSGTYIYAKANTTTYSIGGLNTCTLKGYYRTQSGSYGTGTTLTSGTGRNLTSAASTTRSYVAKIVATDSLGNTAAYETTIPTASVAFHLRTGGEGAAFGKYAEENDLLDIAWSRLKLGGNLLADYIVEQGTSGDWDYIYYKSGRKEAWYNVTHTDVAFTAYGGIYRSPGIIIDQPPSPNDTISVYSIDANGSGATYLVWFAQPMHGSSSYPTKITLRACTVVETTQNVRIRLHVHYR